MKLSNILTNHYPKFETKIPSTGIVVYFRPLLVKEEKKLLTIQEFGSLKEKLNCIKEVLESCFEICVNDLTLTDMQYLFIQLRIKSIDSVVEPIIICPETKEEFKININLEEIQVIESKNKSNTIELDSELSVIMKEPTVGLLLNNNISIIEQKELYKIALYCIETINTKTEMINCKDLSTSDLEEFIDNLTKSQFGLIENYLTNMSKIEKIVSYKTSDGKERSITLRGLDDFFV